MRFTHSRVRPSARYDGRRRRHRHRRVARSPLFCTPWTKALMASVSLSCRLAGFFACLSLSLTLLILFLSHSVPLPLSLSHPLARRVFLLEGFSRYLEENSLFSPATGEIPASTSIAGEWRGVAGEGGRQASRDVGWKPGRKGGEGVKGRTTWLEEKLLRFRIRCVCSGLIGPPHASPCLSPP